MNSESIKKVSDFLTEAKVFYVATVDGDRPKCRPFGFHMIHEGKIYFGMGSFKDVYKQICANPNVEICATIGGEFLRYYGTAVFDPDEALGKKALDMMPPVKKFYEENGHTMAMFYLKDAVAELRTGTGIKESIKV